MTTATGRRDSKPENPLAAAELSMEQNYNQIDGIINNLPPEAVGPQGYMVLESTLFEDNRGIALAHHQPSDNFVTWQYTQEDGHRDYYWGHYYTHAQKDAQQAARHDYADRVAQRRLDGHREVRESVRDQLGQAKQQLDGQTQRRQLLPHELER